MITGIFEILFILIERLFPYLLSIFLASAGIGFAGLLIDSILKKNGYDSVYSVRVLRVTLCALLAVPFIILITMLFRVDGLYFIISGLDAPRYEQSFTNPGIIDTTLPDIAEGTSQNTGNLMNTVHQGRANTHPPITAITDDETVNVISARPVDNIKMYVLPAMAVFFVLLWLTLTAFHLIRLFFRIATLYYVRIHSNEARAYREALGSKIAAQYGMPHPEIRHSEMVDSVVFFGFIHPVIIFPTDGHVTMFQQEVFLHEFAHFMHHDYVWKYVSHLVMTLYPLNPLSRIISRRLDESSDYVADDFVLHYTPSGKSYLRTLLSIIDGMKQDKQESAAMAVCLISGKQSFVKRAEHILSPDKRRALNIQFRELCLMSVAFLSISILTGFSGFRSAEFSPLRTKTVHEVTQLSEYLAVRSSSFVTMLTSPVIEIIGSNEKKQNKQGTSDRDIATAVEDYPGSLSTENQDSIINNDSSAGSTSPSSGTDMQKSAARRRPDSQSAMNVRNSRQLHKPSPGFPTAPTDLSDDTIDDTYIAINMQDITIELPSAEQASQFLAVGGADNGNNSLSGTGADEPAVLVSSARAIDIDISESTTHMLCNPLWSPDGSYIYFNDHAYGVWKVSSEGGKAELLVNDHNNLEWGGWSLDTYGLNTLDISPDGKFICITRRIIDEELGTVVRFQEIDGGAFVTIDNPVTIIERIAIETGIYSLVAKQAVALAYDNSGSNLAYVDNADTTHRLIIRNSATQEEKIILSGYTLKESISFSNDDTHILVSAELEPRSYHICSVPVDGSGEIKKVMPLLNFDNPEDIDISPNNRFILFSAMVSVDDRKMRALMVYDNETDTASRLFPDSATPTLMGRWSPDGTQICYRSIEKGDEKLYIAEFKQPGTDANTNTDEMKPLSYSLSQNYPNPFNMSTTIQFTLASPGETKLYIYNIMGQKIRELVNGDLEAGKHAIVWDGCDERGNTVSSGTYISVLQSGTYHNTKKMTLLK